MEGKFLQKFRVAAKEKKPRERSRSSLCGPPKGEKLGLFNFCLVYKDLKKKEELQAKEAELNKSERSWVVQQSYYHYDKTKEKGYKDQLPWNIKLSTDDSGKHKGDGVLSYEDPSDAQAAGGFYNNLRGYEISDTMVARSAPRVALAFGQGFQVHCFHALRMSELPFVPSAVSSSKDFLHRDS
ncbi:hypothetical protein C5167_026671 [Papaver somniferum]|nr:hypothetical protein C5167_026671 [Papaver somniferum]